MKFGGSQLVAQCLIDDLRNGESANKPTELRALADEIASALQTLTQIGACGEVNKQQFICAIVMRWHPQVCSSWRRLRWKIMRIEMCTLRSSNLQRSWIK